MDKNMDKMLDFILKHVTKLDGSQLTKEEWLSLSEDNQQKLIRSYQQRKIKELEKSGFSLI